jgi:DNA-binding MarR family transcriptional regulator
VATVAAMRPAADDDQVMSAPRVAEVAAFRTALHRFERQTGAAARACGLTPQRYLLLLTIWGTADRAGGATVSSVAEALDLPQTTVSDMVARATAVGLVERAPASDGRSSLLSVTREGKLRVSRTARRLDHDRSALEESLAAALRLIPLGE